MATDAPCKRTAPGKETDDSDASPLVRSSPALPRLRIVCEHITTRTAAEFVASAPDHVAATITPQHLLYTLGHLIQGLKYHLYYLPIVKFHEDREALRQAVTSHGQARFFAGTDSAPHTTKATACGCAAGCFTGGCAPQLYAMAFEETGVDLGTAEGQGLFERFLCLNGPAFYGFPASSQRFQMEKAASGTMAPSSDQYFILTVQSVIEYYCMARSKSIDKRNALLNAATRVIVSQGLSAPTATIAKEAGISNGSLFTYFETKTDLFNQLYLELKTDMATKAMASFPAKAGLQKQMLHVWTNWMEWATASPEKRRALAQLSVSDDITPETRNAGQKIMAEITQLVEQMRNGGPLKNTPMSFVGALINSLAESTMDFMIRDPANAKKHCRVGFETCWRAVG